MSAADQLNAIISRLSAKGEAHANLVWVGPNYSKADLLRDLRDLREVA